VPPAKGGCVEALTPAPLSRTGREFFTVDFSSEGFTNARAVCGACAHQGRGEIFLKGDFAGKSRSGTIAAAYLDNYDWTFPWTTQMRMRPDPELCADSIALGPHIEQSVHVPGGLSMLRGGRYKQQQRIDYTAEGLVLSNEQSRETHLLQAQAVEARCSEQCYILFDDTWPMNPASGRYDGKGGGAVDWLLSRGFELVEQSDPDRASHLGFVLVRRLPREQRQICDVSQEERGVGDKGAGGLVQVSFLAPAQGVGQPHLASRRLTSMRQHPASGPSPLSDLSI
jgi:hypothetical protein